MRKIIWFIRTVFSVAGWSLVIMILLNIVQGIIGAAEIVIFRYFIDGIAACVRQYDIVKIIVPVVFYTVFAILSIVIKKILAYLNWKYSIRMNDGMNNIVWEKCAGIDMAYFHKADFYDDIVRVTQDGVSGMISLISTVMLLIQYFISYISVVVILAGYDIVLLVIINALVVPLVIFEMKFSMKLYRTRLDNTEDNRIIEKLGKLFINYKSNMEIRSYGIKDILLNGIKNVEDRRFNKEKGVRRGQVVMDSGVNIVYVFLIYLLKLIAVIKSIGRKYSLGVITMYVQAIDSLSESMQCIVATAVEFNVSRLYIDSLMKFMGIGDVEGGSHELEGIRSIRFEHVWFRYPETDRYIIKDLSFEANANEICLIKGSNGCGKSTIIKLITGLYTPDRGDIYINNVKIGDIDSSSLNKRITVMFQEYCRYPFTVLRNVDIEEKYHREDIQDVLSKINFDRDIDLQRVLDNEQEGGVEISTGQWQKLAFARAVLREGDVMIFDEPTASIDRETKKLMYGVMSDMTDRIVMVVSHDSADDDLFDKVIYV